MFRGLTLEERIIRLEKLVYNESAADFETCKEDVEDWFWKQHAKNMKRKPGNRERELWIQELNLAKARNTREGFMLGRCIGALCDDNPAVYSCQSQIRNLLGKLSTKALKEIDEN